MNNTAEDRIDLEDRDTWIRVEFPEPMSLTANVAYGVGLKGMTGNFEYTHGGSTASTIAFLNAVTSKYWPRPASAPQDNVGMLDIMLSIASATA